MLDSHTEKPMFLQFLLREVDGADNRRRGFTMKIRVGLAVLLSSLAVFDANASRAVESSRTCSDGSIIQYQSGNWYLNSLKLRRQPIPFAIFHNFNEYAAGSRIHTDGRGRYFLMSSHAYNTMVAIYEVGSSEARQILTCY